MTDATLNDDMLKLVKYRILFVKRDYEHAFEEQEELVSDNTTDTAFTAWKIADFVQNLGTRATPEKWKTKHYPSESSSGYIGTIPDADKKFLRVSFEVKERYPRERFHHDERQIEELAGIRTALREMLTMQKGG